MKYLNLVDWFLPEDIKLDIVRKGKARITVTAMFIFTLVVLSNSLRAFSIGRLDLAMASIFSSFLLAIGPLILKKSKSQLIAGNYFLLVFTLLTTSVTITRGGASSYYALNFATNVVLAFLMTNLLSGMIWSVINALVIVAMRIAEVNGYPFNAVSAEKAHINVLVIIIVIGILSAIIERNSTNNLKRFAWEKNKSEQSAKELKDILDETSDVMSGVARGDLSIGIQSIVQGDLEKLKTSVNNALQLLGDSIAQVIDSSSEINRGTSEISSAVQQLASGSTEQAASVEEISSSMDEIGSRAKTNHKNAAQAQTLSNQAVTELKKGNAQMDTMLEAMNTINETSKNVSKVIKVIDEIAFQTNLLALNAAVEAARAGKYGKGFAVVAEEVRNLAARSSEAARDTTELIETSIINVGNGVESAQVTSETLKGFVEVINSVNDIITEISTASREQTASVTEINNGLQQVNEVVQRNSSIAEESASASEELSSQADILQNLMNRFKLT